MMYKILRWMLIRVGYPIIELTGRIFPAKREGLERKLIYLNNKCVSCLQISKASNVLILIPHCLQNDDCIYRITKDIKNCKECGKCVIKDLAELQDRAGFPIKVATGGSIARKLVKEYKPDIIIACACERDLSSGIYDSFPMVVWGIENKRPNGPCYNTELDIESIEQAINRWCK